MGISIRAYGRHRGVSDAAVRKALKTGRISAEADGSIDPTRADADWARRTDPAQTRGPVRHPRDVPPSLAHRSPVAAEDATAGLAAPGGTSFLQARTVHEVVKAQTGRVRLARLKGELVDRAQAIAQVFRLARTERDAWLNWPARVSQSLALSLNLDAHALHVALEAAVREHLQELGDIRPQLNG